MAAKGSQCDTSQCDLARQFQGSRAMTLSVLEAAFPSASDCIGDVGKGDQSQEKPRQESIL